MTSHEAPIEGTEYIDPLEVVRSWVSNGGKVGYEDLVELSNGDIDQMEAMKVLANATVHAEDKVLASRRFEVLLRLYPGGAFRIDL